MCYKMNETLYYPLYINGPFLQVWYSDFGMVHCITREVTSYNFQIKLMLYIKSVLFLGK